FEERDSLVPTAGGLASQGKIVLGGEGVGVVGSKLGRPEFQGALELLDRPSRLAEKAVAAAQGVSDGGLDAGLVGERGGDLRLGGVHRVADGHIPSQSAFLAGGPRGGQ